MESEGDDMNRKLLRLFHETGDCVEKVPYSISFGIGAETVYSEIKSMTGYPGFDYDDQIVIGAGALLGAFYGDKILRKLKLLYNLSRKKSKLEHELEISEPVLRQYVAGQKEEYSDDNLGAVVDEHGLKTYRNILMALTSLPEIEANKLAIGLEQGWLESKGGSISVKE